MSTEKDNIEHLFEDRFSNFGDDPDASVWEGIQAGVSAKKKKKRAGVFFLVLAACAAFGIYSLFSRAGKTVQQITYITPVADTITGTFEQQDVLSPGGIQTVPQAAAVTASHVQKNTPAHTIQMPVPAAERALQYQQMPVAIYKPAVPSSITSLLPDYHNSLYKPIVQTAFNTKEITPGIKPRKSFRLASAGVFASMSQLSVAGQPHTGRALQKSLALHLDFRITDRWQITGGVGMQQMNVDGWHRHDQPQSYVSDSVLVIDNKREFSYYKYYDTAISTSKTKFTHTYTSVYLPLGLDYTFNPGKKVQFGMGTSIMLGKVLSGTMYNTEVPHLGSKTQEVNFDETNTLLKQYTMQWAYRVSLSYSTGLHTRLMLSPEYTYMLSKTAHVGNRRTGHFSGYGIRAGMMYIF